MDQQKILAACDHTLLLQDATWDEIKVICDDAKKYKTAFDETTLKNRKLKSRIFLGPCTHTPSKIENIVKNGVAMVTTEGCIVADYAPTKFQPETIQNRFR